MFKLKSRNNYQWKWDWRWSSINLYYNCSKYTKSLGNSSGWIIDSVIDHTISNSKYNPSAGSNYIKLPKESDHPRIGLIDIQNTGDDEWFKWCTVRYLNPADHNPGRITKVDKDFVKILDFQEIKFPPQLQAFTKSK